MPYISDEDYKRIQHLLPSENPDLRAMEQGIYALNGRIRALSALPWDGPSPEWLSLMRQHKRLLADYHEAGGKRL